MDHQCVVMLCTVALSSVGVAKVSECPRETLVQDMESRRDCQLAHLSGMRPCPDLQLLHLPWILLQLLQLLQEVCVCFSM